MLDTPLNTRVPDTRRHSLAAAAGFLLLLLAAVPRTVTANDSAYTLTKHSEYQSVFDDGTSKWFAEEYDQVTGTPIEMIGVVINNPWHMLNYATDASPQWQVFFQSVDENDFGGTAMYMRRFHPNSGANLFVGTKWNEEMQRLNYPIYGPTGEVVDEPLRYGDLIKVQASAPGRFFGGKANINTQHTSDPNKAFSVTILERDWEPVASQISLADLKDENDNFIFDELRSTGCEHYQGSLVHLDNLLLVDTDPAKWTLNNVVTVRQGDLTMPMQLGIDPDLGWIDPYQLTTTPFSVTAILNQESGGGPHTGGYRLWLTSAGNLNPVPEPGTWVLALLGFIGCGAMVRRKNHRLTK